MPFKSIELYCSQEKLQAVLDVAEDEHILEKHFIHLADEAKTSHVYLLAKEEHVQVITDKLQSILGKEPTYRVRVMTVDAVVPKFEEKESVEPQKPQDEKPKKKFLGVSREALLETVSAGVNLDINFVLLVIFSTVVAAIGMLEDNVAVVIGAMVIAPLLGPNLALAFGTSLGDRELTVRAMKANLVGVLVCLCVSILIGKFWPAHLTAEQLMMRTQVNYASFVLAVVSGAAAVLSLTKGISSVMVGVMVAVALLPPATTLGIMLGSSNYRAAYGALLLLLVNIVGVNFAAQTTLLLRGIRPRTWYEQQSAGRIARFYLGFWFVALLFLATVIFLWNASVG